MCLKYLSKKSVFITDKEIYIGKTDQWKYETEDRWNYIQHKLENNGFTKTKDELEIYDSSFGLIKYKQRKKRNTLMYRMKSPSELRTMFKKTLKVYEDMKDKGLLNKDNQDTEMNHRHGQTHNPYNNRKVG